MNRYSHSEIYSWSAFFHSKRRLWRMISRSLCPCTSPCHITVAVNRSEMFLRRMQLEQQYISFCHFSCCSSCTTTIAMIYTNSINLNMKYAQFSQSKKLFSVHLKVMDCFFFPQTRNWVWRSISAFTRVTRKTTHTKAVERTTKNFLSDMI